MTNNNLAEKTLSGRSDNVLVGNSTPMAWTAKEKILHTSKLYLKVEATPTDSDSKALPQIAHSNVGQITKLSQS
jgi:hypothetical protein